MRLKVEQSWTYDVEGDEFNSDTYQNDIALLKLSDVLPDNKKNIKEIKIEAAPMKGISPKQHIVQAKRYKLLIVYVYIPVQDHSLLPFRWRNAIHIWLRPNL